MEPIKLYEDVAFFSANNFAWHLIGPLIKTSLLLRCDEELSDPLSKNIMAQLAAPELFTLNLIYYQQRFLGWNIHVPDSLRPENEAW